MRKLLISATVLFALGGVAACNTAAPTPSTSTPPATTAAGGSDQTKEVCNSAVTQATSTGLTISVKANDLKAAVAANDLTKAAQVGADLQKTATDLSAALTAWSNSNVKPEVKTALTDLAGTINKHAAAGANINPTTAESEIKAGIDKLTTACMGS